MFSLFLMVLAIVCSFIMTDPVAVGLVGWIAFSMAVVEGLEYNQKLMERKEEL